MPGLARWQRRRRRCGAWWPLIAAMAAAAAAESPVRLTQFAPLRRDFDTSCSLLLSREAAIIAEAEVLEAAARNAILPLPASCPLLARHNRYARHEMLKAELRGGWWRCRTCNKMFRGSEVYIDHHLFARHATNDTRAVATALATDADWAAILFDDGGTFNGSDSGAQSGDLCFADLCGVLGCPSLANHAVESHAAGFATILQWSGVGGAADADIVADVAEGEEGDTDGVVASRSAEASAPAEVEGLPNPELAAAAGRLRGGSDVKSVPVTALEGHSHGASHDNVHSQPVAAAAMSEPQRRFARQCRALFEACRPPAVIATPPAGNVSGGSSGVLRGAATADPAPGALFQSRVAAWASAMEQRFCHDVEEVVIAAPTPHPRLSAGGDAASTGLVSEASAKLGDSADAADGSTAAAAPGLVQSPMGVAVRSKPKALDRDTYERRRGGASAAAAWWRGSSSVVIVSVIFAVLIGFVLVLALVLCYLDHRDGVRMQEAWAAGRRAAATDGRDVAAERAAAAQIARARSSALELGRQVGSASHRRRRLVEAGHGVPVSGGDTAAISRLADAGDVWAPEVGDSWGGDRDDFAADGGSDSVAQHDVRGSRLLRRMPRVEGDD